MSLLGVRLTILIGPMVPLPVPPILSESFAEAKVTYADTGRSGFQLTFRVGRGGPPGALDYPAVALPLLKAFNRVILVATFSVVPQVVADGIITRSELQPGDRPGQATLVVTGEDVAVMFDLTERSTEHPCQDETIIAHQDHRHVRPVRDRARWSSRRRRWTCRFRSSACRSSKAPTCDYLEQMAARYGYVFYVTPGPDAGHEHRLLGPAGPGRSAPAGDHGQHGCRDERDARRRSRRPPGPDHGPGPGPGPDRPTARCRS